MSCVVKGHKFEYQSKYLGSDNSVKAVTGILMVIEWE